MSSSIFFSKSYSPTLSLPMSHAQLMGTYKNWTRSFFPIKVRTYKKDAAGLLISLNKRFLRKKLWIWRLNCNPIKKQKIDLNIRIKSPLLYTQRKVFVQLEKEKNLVQQKSTRKIKKNLDRLGYISKTTRMYTPIKKNSIIPKLTYKKALEKKINSTKKIYDLIVSHIAFQYMDFFYILLLITKRYWIGKELVKTLTVIINSNFSNVIKQIRYVGSSNSILFFKVFSAKTSKVITYENSPDSKLSDTTCRITDANLTNPFGFSPEILINSDWDSFRHLRHDYSINSSKKLYKSFRNSSEKFNLNLLLEKNFDNGSKIDKGNVERIVQNVKYKKIENIFNAVFSSLAWIKAEIFAKLKKNTRKAIFYEKKGRIANFYRNKCLIRNTFRYWKGMKASNQKLCRSFELLGRFINIKKGEIVKILNLPYPISYYLTDRYKILSNLVKTLYKKKNFLYMTGFKTWKVTKIIGIRLVRLVSMLNKSISINLLISWQRLFQNMQG